MPPTRYIVRLVHFSPHHYRILCGLAPARGRTRRSLSSALHWLIADWLERRLQAETQPAPQVYPETNLLDELPRLVALASRAGQPGQPDCPTPPQP